jgi:hypothetical protein
MASNAVTSLVLSVEDLRKVTEAAAKVAIHGDRYPEHLQRRVGQ